jgi:hypothetical protein
LTAPDRMRSRRPRMYAGLQRRPVVRQAHDRCDDLDGLAFGRAADRTAGIAIDGFGVKRASGAGGSRCAIPAVFSGYSRRASLARFAGVGRPLPTHRDRPCPPSNPRSIRTKNTRYRHRTARRAQQRQSLRTGFPFRDMSRPKLRRTSARWRDPADKETAHPPILGQTGRQFTVTPKKAQRLAAPNWDISGGS